MFFWLHKHQFLNWKIHSIWTCLLPLQTSFWTIKRCRCSRNSTPQRIVLWILFFVNCFEKLNCTKVAY
jgi:hypothetical protein